MTIGQFRIGDWHSFLPCSRLGRDSTSTNGKACWKPMLDVHLSPLFSRNRCISTGCKSFVLAGHIGFYWRNLIVFMVLGGNPGGVAGYCI